MICGFSEAAKAAAPPNDDFAHAQALALSGTISGTAVGSTLEKGDPNKAEGYGGDVWYSFTAPADGNFALTGPFSFPGGSEIDVTLYEGTSLKKLKNIAEAASVTGTGYSLELSGPVVAGKKYYVAVGFIAEQTPGSFQLDYAFETAGGFAFTDPPSNGYYQWTYLEGTNPTINLIVGRYGSTSGTATVNYSIQSDPRLSGSLTGTLTFAPGVTRQSITLGLANDDTSGVADLLAQLSNSSSNATILPLGSIYLRIEGDADTVANDDYANAQALDVSGSPGAVVSGSVALPYGLATTEQEEYPEDNESIWYSVTAPSDGELTVSVDSHVVYFYTGTSVATAGYAPYEDNSAVPVTSGSTYYICVNGINDSTGYLNYSFDPNGSQMDFESFDAFVYDVESKAGTATLTVTRSGATSTTATVHYATNGSGDANAGAGDTSTALATPGVDFTPVQGTLTFAPGVTTGTFQISSLRNPKAKADLQKHVDVVLDDPSGTTLGAAVDAYIYLDFGPQRAGAVEVYSGVLESATGQSTSGLISFTFTKSHDLDAKAQIAGKIYTGHVSDEANTTQYTIPLKGPEGTDPLSVSVQFTGDDFAEVLTGALMDSSTTLATFEMQNEQIEAGPFDLGYEGSYTVALTSGTGAPASVQAPGWASLKILPSDKYIMTGVLPDGTRFTAGGPAEGLGLELPLLVSVAIPLDKGKGTLGGVITVDPAGSITEPAPSGDGFGSLQWVKPETGGTGGFTEILGTTVSQYAPLPLATIFGTSGGALTIGSGTSIQFTFNAKGAAVFPADTPGKPKLSFSAATGVFTGSFTPVGGKATPFSGVILPDIEEGFGFILIDKQATPVTVLPLKPA